MKLRKWKASEVYWDDHKLRQVWNARQRPQRTTPLGSQVQDFLRRVVKPRQKKLEQLGRAWRELLPVEITEHSCLDDLRRGKLRVLADDAATMYELNLLVKEGLVGQLQQSCPAAGVASIKVVPGRWYHVDEDGNRIPDF